MSELKNSCPICGVDLLITGPRFHSTMRENGKIIGAIIGEKAICETCNLPFERWKKSKTGDTGWITTRIINWETDKKIIFEDIPLIEEEISKFKEAFKNWKKFISFRKSDDKLFLFNSKEDHESGILLIRNEEALIDFKIQDYLYKKIEDII